MITSNSSPYNSVRTTSVQEMRWTARVGLLCETAFPSPEPDAIVAAGQGRVAAQAEEGEMTDKVRILVVGVGNMGQSNTPRPTTNPGSSWSA